MSKIKNEKLVLNEFEPTSIISLEYVKNYLRIDNNCDDEFLKNAILVASNYAEKMIGKIIGEKTFIFSCEIDNPTKSIDVAKLQITEIISVKIGEETLQNDAYCMEKTNLVFNQNVVGDAKITFKAGIKTEEIPADIKQAMLYHIASIYQNKEGNFAIPQATQDIYSTYRGVRV